MRVYRKFFPEVLPDNDILYFDYIIGVIESVDELSDLQISKLKDKYHFRLSPSLPKYNNLLLEEILKVHNLFGIHLDISKSIKTSGVIDFKVPCKDQ